MKTIILLDNEGASFDRFTFINTKTGDMLGTSETGEGFFQYAGNIADNYMGTTYGYSWRKHCNVKACIKDSIQRFLDDCEHVGKVRELNTIDVNLAKRAKEYLTINK